MKIIFTPAGGVTIHVDVQGVSYSQGVYQANLVTSYADAAHFPGGMVQTNQNTVTVPSEAVVVNAETTLEQAVLDWLTGLEGPFAGGQQVSDEDFALVAMRLNMRQAVKRKRDAVEQQGVTLAGVGTFDTDTESQRKVNGAVTMALIAMQYSQPFEIVWRLADDTTATLDAAGIIGVGVAVGQHVAACQANKNALDLLIMAAESVEELEAIDLEDGWPA